MLSTNNYPRRCRTGIQSITPFTTGNNTSKVFLSRPKLLFRSYYKPKNTFNNYTNIENAPFNKFKRFKSRKLSSCQKMDISKKKIPDTESAYRETVQKLKYLLNESYSPQLSGKYEKNIYKRSSPRFGELVEEACDEKSVVSEYSKVFPENLSSRTINTGIISEKHNNIPVVLTPENSQLNIKELTSFIMRQEEYIEQLEQETGYCKDELKNVLRKIREVVAENESLHDQNKTSLLKSFLNDYNDFNDNKKLEKPRINDIENQICLPLNKMMDGPSIVYESRISELEAQLTQAKIELKKAQQDNHLQFKRLCENNTHQSPEVTNQLEQVIKEKRELNDKLEEVTKNLQFSRDRETEINQKIKRTVETYQQKEIKMESEICRLKDELERQRDKVRDATQETSRRLNEERLEIERRYSHQVEQLSADIATHWDSASKSQMEIERQRREIFDLKRELVQKQAYTDDLKKDLQSKISNLLSELNQMIAEKDAAEQEVATTKLAIERNERQARQEQNRLNAEINSYKQRIERADADIVHCRRENLRLSEQIASLEKELNMKVETGRITEKSSPAKNEKDLTSMIMDIETKHAATVGGLEDALSNQAILISRLTAQCQSLTQRLEVNNRMHKEEMANLQNNIDILSTTIKETFDNHKELTGTPKTLTRNNVINSNYNPENYETNQQFQPVSDNSHLSDYPLQNNENYPQYSDENYVENYNQEYGQYDPSIYQQDNNPESYANNTINYANEQQEQAPLPASFTSTTAVDEK